MEIKPLPYDLSICRLREGAAVDPSLPFYFLCRTDEELSLVCRTEDAPNDAQRRDDGWRAFRIQGELDFSLIGILARIASVLAENGIGLFAVSTYNTDYILVKADRFSAALEALLAAGYTVV